MNLTKGWSGVKLTEADAQAIIDQAAKGEMTKSLAGVVP